jgi:hypothetical protein
VQVTGAAGEAPKVSVAFEPAFTTVKSKANPNSEIEYPATGKGIVAQVSGYAREGGRKIIGPLTVACTPPSKVALAETPAPQEGHARFSATFNAECVLGPGMFNLLGSTTVTMTATSLERVGSGGELFLSGVSFAITLFSKWDDWLYNLGGGEARGTVTSTSASLIKGSSAAPYPMGAAEVAA